MVSGCAPSWPVCIRRRHRDDVEKGIVVSAEGSGNHDGVAAASVPEERVSGHHGGQVSRLLGIASGQGVGQAIDCGV